ncbi:alpha/beta-hydrolase [Basidiobolus meristosporus CBS 931.73]|uniref:Alpha/beta-hydrolase n=1 Tax=Basidiobolus meristosporus CBS 931.73 TaxID=1314790 RepID=A0A1Y1XJP8_9FUNG|nr:alpha/beta-hydrolase [Basidiobolus meristosporus CBS 931.73]|eukprot:ORX85942.1 alpha/beta-hydrolase [Basidiobolus meristosporus CBS 931.73]
MKWILLLASLSALHNLAGASTHFKRQEIATLENHELDVLKSHAKYASAAYCPEVKLTNWTCGDHCLGKFTMTSYFTSKISGIAGYMGFNRVEKKIVISFRGTSNLSNWFRNLAMYHNTFVYPTADRSVKVHSGFYKTYQSVEKSIREGLQGILKQLRNETEPYKLVITGHSLGGAVASFCAMDIKRFYLNPESDLCFERDLLIVDRSQIYLHTFGQPRAGNAKFAQLVYNTFGANTTRQTLARVTNKNDPVPRLPPHFGGYLHHPHEIYIKHDQNTIACTDVVEQKVREDPNCIDSVTLPVGLSAHSQFWGITFGYGC